MLFAANLINQVVALFATRRVYPLLHHQDGGW